MHNLYADIFRSHFRPMTPIPTDQAPVLAKLHGIWAVLFDLYGTLWVSGSGEIDITRETANEQALGEALAAVGVRVSGPLTPVLECLFRTIDQAHEAGRQVGIDYPEVDMREIWRSVLEESAADGRIAEVGRPVDTAQLAVEYEARANPVWPMPHAEDCLAAMGQKGLLLGIVSNAQFFTPDLFEALWDRLPEACGFAPDVQIFSYRHGWGKPALRLFELAADALQQRGLAPSEALYVGNDMLNDVLPAAKTGFRTALFAGDARSLRLRQEDPRVAGVSPDLVLTSLGQLDGCIIAV